MHDVLDVIKNIQNLYENNSSMAALKDFERVLDDGDLYAYKNWILGELVQGPVIGRYSAKCIFMWPYKNASGKYWIEPPQNVWKSADKTTAKFTCFQFFRYNSR